MLERKNQRNAATSATPPAAPLVRGVSRDREIMTFAVRYPHRLPDLRDYGADLALVAPLGAQTVDETGTLLPRSPTRSRVFGIGP